MRFTRIKIGSRKLAPVYSVVALLLAIIIIETYGGYLLFTHGVQKRFVQVQSLQNLHVTNSQIYDLYAQSIADEAWLNSSDPKERYIGTLGWIMNRVSTVGKSPPRLNPEELLRSTLSTQQAQCGTMATTYHHLLTAAHVPSRIVQLTRNMFDTFDTHVTTEVFVNGKWILVDPTFAVSYVSDTGEYLSAQDLKRALLQGQNTTVKPISYGKFLYPANLDTYYINYLSLYNNVFILENSEPSMLAKIPPFRYWYGPKVFYEKSPNESNQHIVYAQMLYFIFIVVLPILIIVLTIWIVVLIIYNFAALK